MPDTTVPRVELLSTVEHADGSLALHLDVQAEDAGGIERVELRREGEVIARFERPPYRHTVRIDSPTAETTFSASAVDETGNRGVTGRLGVRVNLPAAPRQLGGPGSDSPTGIAAGPDGGAYLVGQTLGDGADVAIGVRVGIPGRACFLARFSSDGEHLWSRDLGFSGQCKARVTVGAEGEVYAANLSWRKSGEHEVEELMVRRFDSEGELLWEEVLEARIDNLGRFTLDALAADPRGGVVVAGEVEGTIAGQGGPGGVDVYRALYSASGKRNWLDLGGTEANDYVLDLAVDSAGEIYLLGSTSEPGCCRGRAFVERISPDGGRRWLRQLDSGREARDIAIAPDGLPLILLSSSSRPFALRFDSEGQPSGARRLALPEAGWRDAVVGPAGDLFLLGTISERLLVVRLNEDLEQVWRREVEIRTDDEEALSFVGGIAAAPGDQAYVAFSTTGPWQGQRSLGHLDAFWLVVGGDGQLVQ